ELTCVGLYPELNILEAIVEIKRETGYLGNLCTTGSTEYVSFYADFGRGYEYVGTRSFQAHNLPRPNNQHPLNYAVRLYANEKFRERLLACNQENIIHIKAILSWNQNPAPFGQGYTPAYGNVLTCKVPLRPLGGLTDTCKIDLISGVAVTDPLLPGSLIDQNEMSPSVGLAFKAGSSGGGVFDRPFGGIIEVEGHVDIAGATYYRVLYKALGAPDSAYTPLPDPFRYYVQGGTRQTAKPVDVVQKWMSISSLLSHIADPLNGEKTALQHFRSQTLTDGSYTLRLEVADSTFTPLPGQTFDTHVTIDNTSVRWFDFSGTSRFLPSTGITVKNKQRDFQRCGQFDAHDTIHVWGNFAHPYYRNYVLRIYGGNISQGGYTFDADDLKPPIPFTENGFYDAPTSNVKDTG
ncbi:MAG: hypothetical protein AAFR59_16775, partial [Bacteroidota bacterium]